MNQYLPFWETAFSEIEKRLFGHIFKFCSGALRVTFKLHLLRDIDNYIELVFYRDICLYISKRRKPCNCLLQRRLQGSSNFWGNQKAHICSNANCAINRHCVLKHTQKCNVQFSIHMAKYVGKNISFIISSKIFPILFKLFQS